jgi:hypothetical protein
VKAGMRANDLRLVLQHDATLDLSLFESIKGSEHPIGDTLSPRAATSARRAAVPVHRVAGRAGGCPVAPRALDCSASPLDREPAARAWKVRRRPPGRRGQARWRRSLPSRSKAGTTRFGRWSAAQNCRHRATGSEACLSRADASHGGPRCAAASV